MGEMVSDMARAVRAAAMYPHRHPARERLLAKFHEKVFSLLADFGKIEMGVSAAGLTFLGDPVETRDGSATLLGEELFLRQVGTLSFVKGITLIDVEALADLVHTSPEEVRAAGGASAFTMSKGAQALRVEEVDYDGILRRREETDEGKSSYGQEVASPGGVPDREGRAGAPLVFDDDGLPEVTQDEWLDKKLWELDSAPDFPTYKATLREIFLNLRSTGALNLPQFTEVVIGRLGRHLDDARPPEVRELARSGVRELASPQVLELLVGRLTRRNTRNREGVMAVFSAAPEKAIPALLIGLVNEKGTFGRKAIMTALSSFGTQVRPFLEGALEDERWFVVRNALGLLAETGNEKDAPAVQRFLAHENPKVRMEALRFFTRHHAPSAERHILALLQDPDPEVRARAVFTLGARGGRKSFQRLVGMAKKPFWGEGDIPLRETAIRSLGRMGGNDAVLFLRSLLRGRGVIDPDGHARLEKAVVEALAEIGGDLAAEALSRASGRLRGDTLRAAQDYLRRAAE